jgi:hypothetical protein
MVEVGTRRVEAGPARKRSSAARDFPEAGGPVIKERVASSQYPVASGQISSQANSGYWLLATGYFYYGFGANCGGISPIIF